MSFTLPQRRLFFAAALLMLIGLATGVLVSAAMTGKIPADGHMMLASHLNALLGCFWIVAFTVTMPVLGFSEQTVVRLGMLTVLPNYSNWLITLIKSFLKVSGVDYVGEAKNDFIFGLLSLFVVIPSFAAAFFWVLGLWRGLNARAQAN